MNALARFIAVVRRWPYCAVCVIVALLSLAAVWFLRDEIQRLRVAHADRTKEGEAMLALLVGASTVRQELELVRESTHRMEENLVVEGNLAENIGYFYKLEEQTKARFSELHPLSSPTTDKSPLYRRVPFSLRIGGAYEQVAAFVRALETGPRIAKINSFNYARTDAAGLAIALDLNVEFLGKR